MAVDTNKLAALVEEQSQNPLASMPEIGGEEEDMPEEEGMEEGEAPDGEALLEELGEFGAMLRENADVIVPIAEEIGEDLGGDSEYMPETEDAVADAVERMPDELSAGLAENLSGRPLEELNAIGEVLVREVDSSATPAGESSPEEAELVGGLLEVGAKLAESPEEDEEEGEEEFEEEEGEEEFEEEPSPEEEMM